MSECREILLTPDTRGKKAGRSSFDADEGRFCSTLFGFSLVAAGAVLGLSSVELRYTCLSKLYVKAHRQTLVSQKGTLQMLYALAYLESCL